MASAMALTMDARDALRNDIRVFQSIHQVFSHSLAMHHFDYEVYAALPGATETLNTRRTVMFMSVMSQEMHWTNRNRNFSL